MAATEFLNPNENAGTELLEPTLAKPQAKRDEQSTPSFQGRISQGEVVNGFTITENFNASGGEAELYFCEKDGLRYVLKYYYDSGEDDEILEKLKSLRHENVMSLIDYGKYKNQFYSILEFAEGGTVSDKVGQKWKFLPLSEEKAIEAIHEILEGLNTIHKKGIIHRDIKPDNLFYKTAKPADEDGRAIGSGILLGDFGISSIFDAEGGMTSHYTEHTEHEFATIGYEAPEMYAIGRDSTSGAIVKRISPAIDYYALGITIWALVTAKEPFVDEKGNFLPQGQIMRNATYKQTANILITRSPELSDSMKKLIRGLLVTRHKERWDYDKVKAHLAGKDVEVFQEDVRDMPPIEIAGQTCNSRIEISRALLAHPKEGRQLVFGGKLMEYMWTLVPEEIVEQSVAEELFDMIEEFSSKGEEEEGYYAIAYSLTPNLPFVIGSYKDANAKEKKAEIRTMADVRDFLETDPQLIIPALRDPSRGFYAFIDVQTKSINTQLKLNTSEDMSAKVRAVVNSTKSDLKLVPRLQVAFRNNVIAPFQDGINDSRELRSIEQLEELPVHLKERFIIFLEMKRDDVVAWIENLSGKNIDIWLDKYKCQMEKLIAWGSWKNFQLFLQGRDIQVHKPFCTGDGASRRWGLRNSQAEEILAPVWDFAAGISPANSFIIKKNGKWGVIKPDGSELISTSWELIVPFDEERALYQCKDSNGNWSIIQSAGFAVQSAGFAVSEEQKTLYTGKELLKIATAPNSPFDIIYDSEHYYSYDTFSPINASGSSFAIANTRDKNYIWLRGDKGATVHDGTGALLSTTTYTNFHTTANSPAVMVEKNGKWGLASPDGARELLACIFAEIRSGGEYYALFMPSKASGILCRLIGSQKKDLYWLKFDKSGAVDILPAGGGDAIASFSSVYNLGLDYAPATDSFVIDDKIACLDGSSLVYFDINTGKTIERNSVEKGEIGVIFSRFDGEGLYAFLSKLKERKAYSSMNMLINAAAEFDQEAKSSWALSKGAKHWLKILTLIDPEHTEELAHGYDVYLSWMGKEALDKDDTLTAQKYYAEAISLNPDNAAYHAGAAAVYFMTGDHSHAVESFGNAATLSKTKLLTTQYLAGKGSALFYSSKNTEAVAAFTQAIDVGVATAEILNARAAAYQQLNLGDKARADIETAANASQSTVGKTLRGGVPLPTPRASAVNIDQVAKAGNVQTIIKAIDVLKTEGSIAAMNALIDASWQQFKDKKDYESVVQILKNVNPQAAQGLKQRPSWYFNEMGICFYSMGKYTEAVPYFLDASQGEPQNPYYPYSCGISYYNLKDWEKAASCFKKSASLGYSKANEELDKMKREKKIQ